MGIGINIMSNIITFPNNKRVVAIATREAMLKRLLRLSGRYLDLGYTLGAYVNYKEEIEALMEIINDVCKEE